jgi:transitional endoplasmic reticulum ATPase
MNVEARKLVKAVSLKVGEARAEDVGRGVARVDPEVMERLGLATGDTVGIAGSRDAVARLLPNFPADRAKSVVRIDGATRLNAGAAVDKDVEIRPVACRGAKSIVIRAAAGRRLTEVDIEYTAKRIDGVPVRAGDQLRVVMVGGHYEEFTVETTVPPGPVIIQPATLLEVLTAPAASPGQPERSREGFASYEDVGGLEKEILRLREMVELPLTRPDLFARLGITPPRGVLIYGPPGTGKTLLARVVAQEASARFFHVNGPEIIQKFYGQSEAALRDIFEKARKAAPAIIFIDEIDAIAPKRDQVVGDVEKRVVAQLLTLMDGLKDRGDVIVIAATNLPNAIDPALRRPGRFDREISLGVPNVEGRRKILAIHSRGMPLGPDVDLGRVAEMTHGFTGADLQALCREAAIAVLRRHKLLLGGGEVTAADLELRMEDFDETVPQIIPSALREVTIETPSVRWEDVGGMEAIKESLRETIVWPVQHAEIFRRFDLEPPRGIILHGPPGTGKTLLARALASEAKINFISVRGPELLSKYVGDSERAVREAFGRARQAAPCILFIDEIDSLTPRRGRSSGTDVTDRVVAQFLTELDGVRPLRDVWLVATTNRLDLIDSALLRPGRLELKLAVGLPELASRRAVLEVHARKKPLAADVDLDRMAEVTEGFSGADLATLCRRAALAAVRREVSGSKSRRGSNLAVRMIDFDDALADMRLSEPPARDDAMNHAGGRS